MNDELLEECLAEIFSKENTDIIWENRNDKADIIALNTSLPIRFVRNESNGRNVEIIIGSKLGDYCSTIFLISEDKFYLPKNVYAHASKFSRDYYNIRFSSYELRREYQILMGAFSVESYFQAFKNIDIDSYKSYNLDFEIVKSIDGNLETFIKKNSKNGMTSFNELMGLEKTSLENVALSSFRKENDFLVLNPTINSEKWIETLKKKRLLELYTI